MVDAEKQRRLFSMDDMVVVAAGGAGAIGSALARGTAQFGAKVAIADVSEQAAGETAAGIAADTGAAALGVALDVRDADSVARALACVEQQLGPVDVLINAVGTQSDQPAEEYALADWDRVMDLNLRGAFVLSQAAARTMIAHDKGGSIIHITSVRSALGIRSGYAAYCASKGGLGILIKQLATEWAPRGIRVNGIAPTFTRTPLVDRYLNDPVFYSGLVARIPMGRVCETDDLVGIGVFLASPASAFITGQNIFVDGGVTACQ